VGLPFICGPHWGKVRALINDRGAPIKEVLPGMPVELVGFSDMPHVGDEVVIMDSERSVKKLSEERQEENRQKKNFFGFMAAPKPTIPQQRKRERKKFWGITSTFLKVTF
jgi:translation initiation factor IF-2